MGDSGLRGVRIILSAGDRGDETCLYLVFEVLRQPPRWPRAFRLGAHRSAETEQLVKKHIAVVLATAACAFATGVAQAADVHWSIGINLPRIATVVSNAPVYHHAPPVYYRPAPVYVAPPPVVYVAPPPRVVYRPVPVVYAPPPPVYYQPVPVVVYGNGHKHHNHHQAHWRDRDHDGRYDDYGHYRDGRWVRLDPRRHRHGG
jgi:hypothetical protein